MTFISHRSEKVIRQRPGRSLLPIVLLSAADFTVMTTEFIIVGLLPSMAADLGVSVSQAGLLVTLFALTVAAAGPFLTARLIGYERKKLFIFTLLLFALSNLVAAGASNIWVMALARFIPALMLPVFWSLASDTAVQITGPENAGKAISTVGFGVVAATIFGIPIGTLILDRFGWRSAFAVLAVLALAKVVFLFIFLPRIPAKQERIPRRFIWELGGRTSGRSSSTRRFCSLLSYLSLANGQIALVPFIKESFVLALVLVVLGICQAALFTVSHTRVMKATEGRAALGASFNISGCNIGIALDAFIGSRVIDLLGLGSVGLAGNW